MSDSYSFVAQYDGDCARCEESLKGHRVKYVAGDLVHTGCADSEGVLTGTRKEKTCPKCWLIMPCGCDEDATALLRQGNPDAVSGSRETDR